MIDLQYLCCVFLFALVLTIALHFGCRRNVERWVSPEGKMTGAFRWLLGELVPLGGLGVYLLALVDIWLRCVPGQTWHFLCVVAPRFLDDYFSVGDPGFCLGPLVGVFVWMLSLRPAYQGRDDSR